MPYRNRIFLACIGSLSLLGLAACERATDAGGDAATGAASALPARSPAPTPAAMARPARAALSLDHARSRAARISDVRYALAFELDGQAADYRGRVVSRFALSAAAAQADLTVDFAGGTVSALTVNGQSLPASYNGFYIVLPGTALRAGENSVEIEFSHPYSNDGSGLYRFEDPEDGRHYMYTDFEPYDQNRLFPSFDQPDLKARYTTEATVPSSWQVIANVTEAEVVDSDGRRVWRFPETPPISTYIYALHAGDYHVWEADADGVPLRLFARESIVPWVYPEHWFGPTRQGLAFFGDYFGLAYPFAKYDQVIVPHFNAGAMENAAAVTFAERYLTRGSVTRQHRRRIASVILHEMAHMWFGDLVTMDWWNGLWLNESFATFMATLAMAEATEFTDEWQAAFRSKIGAYDADQRDTTHPIELPTPDTDAAFANFDSITYNKGSAVLTQLNHLVGPEAFRAGVSQYLQTHAWGNTTIEDFLAAISAAADVDLGPWAQDWLHTPGTNVVAVDFSCDNGQLASVRIAQSAPASWPTLRRHRAQLGLYRFDDSGVRIETLPVSYAGAATEVAGDGRACPDLIYANHGDWDFVRVALDATAIGQLQTNLNRFDDPLIRGMLWQSLYDRVLDGAMPPADFIDLALANIGAESVDDITSQALGGLAGAVDLLARIAPDDSARAAQGAAVEAFLWQQAREAPPGSDRQLLFFDRYVALAATPAGRDRLAMLVSDPAAVPAGITLDQDRRWTVVTRLAGFGEAGAAVLLAAERAADPTDDGRLRALSATAAAARGEAQRALVEQLLAAGASLSVAEARAIASGLYPSNQAALQRPVSIEVLGRLEAVSNTVDAVYFGAITGGLLGTHCDADYLAQLDEAVAGSASLHPTLQKTLLDRRFDVRRCLQIAAAL